MKTLVVPLVALALLFGVPAVSADYVDDLVEWAEGPKTLTDDPTDQLPPVPCVRDLSFNSPSGQRAEFAGALCLDDDRLSLSYIYVGVDSNFDGRCDEGYKIEF